jgi:hypothetical protein
VRVGIANQPVEDQRVAKRRDVFVRRRNRSVVAGFFRLSLAVRYRRSEQRRYCDSPRSAVGLIFTGRMQTESLAKVFSMYSMDWHGSGEYTHLYGDVRGHHAHIDTVVALDHDSLLVAEHPSLGACGWEAECSCQIEAQMLVFDMAVQVG